MQKKPAIILALFVLSSALLSAQPRQRITATIEDQKTVRLAGNRHPMARPQFDSGPADPSHRMDRMILTLRASEEQEAALTALLEGQHDPKSPLFHKWITPDQFAARFGVHPDDVSKVAAWLRSHGFRVQEMPAGGRSIIFSGTAANVRNAFHTEIRRFNVNGEQHYANASDPEIPEALAPVVGGVVTMHDFRRRHFHSKPQFNYGSNHYLSPADYATIYNLNPLYAAGIDGTGQTIAIVGRVNIKLSDVQTFRSTNGLPANDPVIVLNGTDPGIYNSGEEAEADLDVEWSGAVAPKATVKFVISASTSSDGVDLSASYIVSHNLAPVMSTSFGSCEANMGTSENAFYNSLWQQAASQGITALIASGDSGAAGCDYGSTGTRNGVNGLCSSPYSVCVGGTEFAEGGNAAAYWGSSNTSARGSAVSYIPEVAWNESGSNGGSGLWATGGGASILYAKPSWQTGHGVPPDGQRDVPDVSLTAAGHDAYLYYQEGGLGAVSGTSAASPSFAGIMALVNQSTRTRQGNANTTFYALANLQNNGGPNTYFHATTGGNNTVPGVQGFNANTNYNQATGLGSVDANVLVTHWNDTSTPTITLSVPATATLTIGNSGAYNGSVSPVNGFSSNVTLSHSGAPSGVNASLSTTTITAGSGSFTLTVDATQATVQGTFPLVITATGGGQTSTATVSLVLTGPTFTFSGSATQLTLAPGASNTVTFNTSAGTGFSSALALSLSTPANGITASLSASSVASPGAGASTLTVSVGSAVTPGGYSLTVTATGGGVTKTLTLPVTVTQPPTCTLWPSSGPVSVTYGYVVSFQVGCIHIVGGFNTPLTLTATGALPGSTVTVTPSTFTPGVSVSTVAIQPSSTATTGTTTLLLTATGGGVTLTYPMSLTVNPQANYLFALSGNSISVGQGATGTLRISTLHQGSFNAIVALSVKGLPTGVTAQLSPGTIAAPGDGSSTLTFAADAKLSTPGTYSVQVSALGSGLMKTQTVSLTVTGQPVTLSANTANLTAQQSGTASVTVSTTSAANAAVALAIPNLPTGVTAAIGTSTVAGDHRTALVTFTIGASATPGQYPITISGALKSQTASLQIILTVTVRPTFTLTATPAITITRGASGNVTIQTASTNGFNTAVNLAVSGLPAGVTATFAPARIGNGGAGAATLTLKTTTAAKAGTSALTLNATGAGASSTATISLTIN